MVNIQALIDDARCFETVRTMRWPDGVRCPECDRMASVEVPDGKCTCGSVLPEPLAYW